jgi:hypothetical protein
MIASTLTTAEQLREAQWALMDRLYDDATRAEANAEYDANIERARELGLLPTMHCNAIDPDKFSLFSDCWKDQYGMRPRHHVTRSDVERFFKEQ